MEARLADTEQLAASKLLAQSHELQLQLKEGKILGEVKLAAELQVWYGSIINISIFQLYRTKQELCEFLIVD